MKVLLKIESKPLYNIKHIINVKGETQFKISLKMKKITGVIQWCGVEYME